jgi:hypothetical protein
MTFTRREAMPKPRAAGVNHQATDLGLGGRFVSARCQLNDSSAENVFGGPVYDVKQPVLPCRIAENMRRTIEKCSLVQRLDEGERKLVFGLPRQSDLDSVLIPDHCRSMDHLAAPRLRGDYPGGTGAASALDDSRKVLGDDFSAVQHYEKLT